MIELETEITAKLLELSRYASNGNDLSQNYNDLYPENDILVDPATCQAPHIEDFIIANYLSEQREVIFFKQRLYRLTYTNGFAAQIPC